MHIHTYALLFFKLVIVIHFLHFVIFFMEIKGSCFSEFQVMFTSFVIQIVPFRIM